MTNKLKSTLVWLVNWYDTAPRWQVYGAIAAGGFVLGWVIG